MVSSVLWFLIIVAVLACIGGIVVWRKKKRGEGDGLREEVTENVADLNDRFNRARYQDEDGK